MDTHLDIAAHDFYLLRNPLLSIDELFAFEEGRFHEDKNAFENILREKFLNPTLQEAIYMASPELFREFKKWLNYEKLSEKDVDKLLLTLYKYYLRMSSRCTPYGLFAGCSVGKLGTENTAIQFNQSEKYRKYSRLDMNYVAELAESIASQPKVREQIKFYLNSSIYQLGNKLRFVEGRIKNKNRSYFLSSLSVAEHLEKIVACAKQGATIRQLAEILVSNEVSMADAKGFIEELINCSFIISEFEPTVTGSEFYDVLIEKTQQYGVDTNIIDKLYRIKTLLGNQDSDTQKYFEIANIINDTFKKTSAKDLIQTDLFYNTQQNFLSKNVENILIQDLQKLLVLSRKNINTNLDTFKKRFYERYEEKEVPLLVALDSELGIGYGNVSGSRADNSPLVDDISLPRAAKNTTANWNTLDKFKFEKYQQVIQNKGKELNLTDEDLKVFADNNDKTLNIPDSSFLFGSLLGASEKALDEGDFKFVLHACNGPSAANLLGRFCHGSEYLTHKVKECIEEEEAHNPEAIYAEVVHLPEARIGNILMRPTLRKYEIPYLGKPSVDNDGIIDLEDLLVSVKYGNQLVLRSKKHGKMVIPRLTSAHNYHRGLPVYKFLCDLQSYGLHSSVSWDWGLIADQPFLPRVTYKHYILSRASWTITLTNYPVLSAKTQNLKSTFTPIREQLDLPQFVTLIEGDNELLINLENEFSLKILQEKLIKKNKVILAEYLAIPANCFVADQQGRYTNELLIPFKKLQTELIAQPFIPQKEISVTRTFAVGSEWLYLKIYTGTKTADSLLTSVIKPTIDKLMEEGVIDKWFFIRYRDTDEHLRLRFHSNSNPLFYGYVLKAIHEALKDLIDKGVVYNLQTDTYNREIERYGNATIALAEELFFNDSVAILAFLDMIEGDEGERYRWLFALRGIDMLFDDFGYELTDKYRIINQMRENFFQEFGGRHSMMVQLNDKYRAVSKDIQRFMQDPANSDESEITPAVEVFRERSKRNDFIIQEIRNIQKIDSQTLSFDATIPSYIHMFMNRLFISNQRLHELVIYHYLSKYYESLIARMKKSQKIEKVLETVKS
ncbi:thiopeptide-type bacteriocin biosynthesis protein [Arcicella aurantiaca]|uniref:Thiopeptide-type bacteriocin biosynthesis protein n=1 Tax=Arcicella aurantiaca TaxID=591202 RepID=A0A316E569_9BACT|nr:lantibiotic dehydratase [Arcicella aurantiaca]PWK18070.1 thiopeptide-type bacteriocin biosynthesis protein [Arcicella aurantiaca]